MSETMTAQDRKQLQKVADDYYAGRISVREAFERAFGNRAPAKTEPSNVIRLRSRTRPGSERGKGQPAKAAK